MFRSISTLLICSASLALCAVEVDRPKPMRLLDMGPLLTDLAPPIHHNGSVEIATGQFYDEGCDLSAIGPAALTWDRRTDSCCAQQPIAAGWTMGLSLLAPQGSYTKPGFSFPTGQGPIPKVSCSQAIRSLSAEESPWGIALVELQSADNLNWSLKRGDGSDLSYLYDKQMRLQKIFCNTMGRELGSIEFAYDTKEHRTLVKSNDEREVLYVIGPRHQLAAVSYNGILSHSYEYGAEGLFRYLHEETPLRVTHKRYASGRFLQNEYYAARENWVGSRKIYLEGRLPANGRHKRCDHPTTGRIKEQWEPTGPNGKRAITAQYLYSYNFDKEGGSSFSGGTTEAYDGYGNRTLYEWNREGVVTKRSRFEGESQLLLSERWEIDSDGRRITKTLLDSEERPIAAIRLIMDAAFNTTEIRLWRDLRGIQLDESSSYAVHFAYEPCRGDSYRCTREWSDDYWVDFTYWGDTDLVASALMWVDGQVTNRSFYAYDTMGVRIEEIEDNGGSTSPDDLQGVTQRSVVRTTPYTTGAVGLPEEIATSVWDAQAGCERPVSRVVYTYGKYNQVATERHFDAQEVLVKEIVRTFGKKGGLLESESVDQKKRTYNRNEDTGLLQSISGPGEKEREVYTYDGMGRLAKVERSQDDTLELTQEYRYDLRDNCVYERGESGEIVESSYDPLDRLTVRRVTIGKTTTQTNFTYNPFGEVVSESSECFSLAK